MIPFVCVGVVLFWNAEQEVPTIIPFKGQRSSENLPGGGYEDYIKWLWQVNESVRVTGWVNLG